MDSETALDPDTVLDIFIDTHIYTGNDTANDRNILSNCNIDWEKNV